MTLPNEDSFELMAVTSHIGSTANSGHYVSFVRTGQEWTLCNDNSLCNVAEASVKTRDNYVYVYQKVTITNDEEKYPAFIPQTYWQEVQSWQSVPHGCHIRADFETGKRFAKIEEPNTAKTKVEKTIKSKLIENDPDVKVKKRKDDRTDSDENNKQNQQKQQKKAPKSINKKQQTSDLSSEMQKCGNCNRNVVDLSKHLESKVCNGININENSTTCRGCKKQYLRLLPHLNSKNGKGCKDLYTEHELEKPSKEKKYYNKNRGKVKAKNKCYYENNREETSAMRREYYEANKEEIIRKTRKYYEANKEEIIGKKGEYYEANKEKILQKIKIKRENLTLDDCLKLFKQEIVWGPIFPCICCHRMCYRTGVTVANLDKLGAQPIFEKAVKQSDLERNESFVKRDSYWICHNCLLYISKNKMPKIASENSLRVYDRPGFLNLTEVENVMIAPRINFMKLIKMPVSRMTGITDKVINVPISDETLVKNIKSLPRTLEESSVIPIMIKRKKEFLTSMYQQYIRPEFIRKSVQYLKDKYPFYNGLDFDDKKMNDIMKMLDECEEDLGNAEFEELDDSISVNEAELELEEITYIEKDAVRKNQTAVSSSTFLMPENIEGKIKPKKKNSKPDFPSKESLIFAPGEGQTPTNILRELHPFVLHFPCLFPDGKCGLNDPERKVKITPQQFIMQRLLNINPVFARNKPFLFSAVHYLEKYQLEYRMNISYMRGQVRNNAEGKKLLQTEDGFAVFDSIPGSPKYWQKFKYDLIAKLEQLGPFQFFYTLSCADKRWDENLANVITKTFPQLIVLHRLEEISNSEANLDPEEDTIRLSDEDYYSDEDELENLEKEDKVILEDSETPPKHWPGASDYFIHEKIIDNKENCESNCPIHSYSDNFKCRRSNLSEFPKEEKIRLLSENVLDVSRNFNNRVKAFRKNILMASQSPLHVQYYQDRVEFQSRGNIFN